MTLDLAHVWGQQAQQPHYSSICGNYSSGKWPDWRRHWNVVCSPISHRNQGVCAEGGGREGKVHALRIMFCSWTSWQRAVLNAGKGWLLNLESQHGLAFLFTRYLFSVPGCLPWGGHPWGQFLFPCHCWPSLPECDMIVSWGTVQRCQGRTEVAHASAIFLQKKKKKTIELGNPGLNVLFLVCKWGHCPDSASRP